MLDHNLLLLVGRGASLVTELLDVLNFLELLQLLFLAFFNTLLLEDFFLATDLLLRVKILVTVVSLLVCMETTRSVVIIVRLVINVGVDHVDVHSSSTHAELVNPAVKIYMVSHRVVKVVCRVEEVSSETLRLQEVLFLGHLAKFYSSLRCCVNHFGCAALLLNNKVSFDRFCHVDLRVRLWLLREVRCSCFSRIFDPL